MIFISSQLCQSILDVTDPFWEERIAPGDHVKTAATTFFGPDFFLLTPKVHIRTRWFLAFFFSKRVLSLESLRKKSTEFLGRLNFS